VETLSVGSENKSLILPFLSIFLSLPLALFLFFDMTGCQNETDLNYRFFPMVLAIIFAYLVASLFIGVFEMVVDTIFICFCEDGERNDGSMERPYFMSDNLMKFMRRQDRRAQKRTLSQRKGSKKV
jgi:hypothetical protein